MNDVVTPILAKLTRGASLTPDEIDAALGEMLEGRVADVQAAGFIVALRTKGETDEELAALVRAMHRYATHVDVPDGAIDTCGTGGDRSGTVNVSTMAALIAAGAGAKVVKHGNRAQSSQCGSADVLEALGVAIELGPEGVARCVREAGVGFCLAPRYHPAMRFLGPARKELGVPTTFNFLGPLANPARVRRQAVGVSDETMATKMLGALRRARRRAGDGVPRRRRPRRAHDDDDERGARARRRRAPHLDARSARLRHRSRPHPSSSRAATRSTNARAIHAVLAGEEGAFRDIALVNAAGRAHRGGNGARLRRGARSRGRIDRRRRRGARPRCNGPRQFRRESGRGGIERRRWHRCCSVPIAGRSIRSTRSATQRRFPCSGCGRTLKVPEVARAHVAAAPTPAPAPVAPERDAASCRSRRRRRPSRRTAPAPASRAAPARRPPTPTTRRRAVVDALLLWIVAVPLSFLVVFSLARMSGLFTHDQLTDVFLANGRSRFWPFARVLPFVALLTALIVQGGVVLLGRRRAATRPALRRRDRRPRGAATRSSRRPARAAADPRSVEPARDR